MWSLLTVLSQGIIQLRDGVEADLEGDMAEQEEQAGAEERFDETPRVPYTWRMKTERERDSVMYTSD